MTVLAVVGVVPENGSNPYVIMGADSKKISRKEGREDIIDEEYRKVFKNNDKLIGASGRFDDAYIAEIIKIFFEFKSNRPIIDLVELIEKFTTEFLETNPNDKIRALILVAEVENNKLTIAQIDIFEDGKMDTKIHYDIKKYIIITNMRGNRVEAYLEEQINENDDFENVKEQAKNSLKEASKLRPDICNQNIRIESIVE